MARSAFYAGYLAVFLPVVIGGCYLLQILWPHLGPYQWVLIGWKLLEQQGVNPFQLDYVLALPIGLVLAECTWRQLPSAYRR